MGPGHSPEATSDFNYTRFFIWNLVLKDPYLGPALTNL